MAIVIDGTGLEEDNTIHKIRYDVVNETTKSVDNLVQDIERISDIGVYLNQEAMVLDEFSLRNLLTQLKQDMNSILATSATGIPTYYNSLSQLGILAEDDDTLTINTSQLNEVLGSSIGQVKELFTNVKDGIATRLTNILEVMTNDSRGTIQIKKAVLEDIISQLDQEKVTRKQRLQLLDYYKNQISQSSVLNILEELV